MCTLLGYSYAAVDSSWIVEALLPTAQKLINEFEVEAKQQGLDTSNSDSLILLWEAVQAGFR